MCTRMWPLARQGRGGNNARSRVRRRFAQLLQDGTPNGNFAPGGITNIGTPPDLGINAVVLPGPHSAVLAGSAGNNLYVSRWLLPPSRGKPRPHLAVSSPR
jgi:hypothetical protein